MSEPETVDSDQELLQSAVQSHSEGRIADAECLYGRFIERHPDHSDALHLRGMALYQLGDLDAAEENIRAAIAARPDHCDYHANLGLVLKKKNQYRDAIECFSLALALKPDFPDCLSNMASTYLALGQDSDAEDIYRALLDTHPGYVEASNNLGVLLMSRGRLDEARGYLQNALDLKPDYVDALVNFGRLMIRAESFGDAVNAYRRALELDGRNLSVVRDYCEALTKNDNLDVALQVSQQAISMSPDDPENLVTLGNVYQAMRQHDEAEEYYRKALAIDSSSVRAANNLGTIFMHRGDEYRAFESFRTALNGDPDFVEAIFNAGTACQQLGNLDEAEKYYKDALARRPDLPRAYRYLAEIYRADGRADEHRLVLEAWLEQFPESATAKHLLAASGAESAPTRASDDYIREEFDDFAELFDETLAKLDYKTPELIGDLLRRTLADSHMVQTILDAGCGTGLCGRYLQEFGSSIVGVDLSQNMLDRAAARNIYDELVNAELVSFMNERPAEFDLVVATDTLVYFGSLDEVLAAARLSLKPSGYLSFSVEYLPEDSGEDYRLMQSGRFSHAESYLTGRMAEAGFQLAAIEKAALRLESRKPVEGLLVVGRLAQTEVE